jgi:hypothetical protein
MGKAPEDWRSPRACGRKHNALGPRSIVECGGPLPLLHRSAGGGTLMFRRLWGKRERIGPGPRYGVHLKAATAPMLCSKPKRWLETVFGERRPEKFPFRKPA